MDHVHQYLKQIKKFEDVYPITKDLAKKEKGDLFEIFTHHLFKLDPRLNNQLQEIWLYNNIPTKIRLELKLPVKDKGIDLLAKINDEYYPIQCKFRQNPQITILWADLSTFFGLSFGMNHKVNKGFLITNTFDLCEQVQWKINNWSNQTTRTTRATPWMVLE
jgi:predicted helicase